MPIIKVNNINMYYEMHGVGEPMVLIAGLGVDHTIFRLIINQFAQKFKVLVFDNRGVGFTDKPDIPYSINMMANDTAALMSKVGIEKAHVIGVSMGGRISMALFLQHPDKVKSLVLVSTVAIGKRRSSLHIAKFMKLVRSSMSKSQQPYYAFTRQLKAARLYDCSKRLCEINVPTLILHGKKDKNAPYKLAEEMHDGIKGSKIIAFQGGHLFFMWQNKRVVDEIVGFLDSIK